MAARTLLGCRSQRQWRLNPLSTTFQLLWPWMSRSPSLSLRFLTHPFIHSFIQRSLHVRRSSAPRHLCLYARR